MESFKREILLRYRTFVRLIRLITLLFLFLKVGIVTSLVFFDVAYFDRLGHHRPHLPLLELAPLVDFLQPSCLLLRSDTLLLSDSGQSSLLSLERPALDQLTSKVS